MPGTRVDLGGGHGGHVVAGVRIGLRRRRHCRHVVTRMRINDRGLSRHLMAGVRVGSWRRLRGRHDMTGVRVLRRRRGGRLRPNGRSGRGSRRR
ncbi:hypothetical protein, partial [Brevundimonas sp.]|uniref:hypothetical protein n=1 Tax=Brevundimonas sp. TaxID=1871086 RepID=UPI0028AA15C9